MNNNKINKKLILLLIITNFIFVKSDVITKINTIRNMDAHTREFINKIGDIKNSAGVLKGKFNCLKKNKDLSKCTKRNCATTKECLFSIFSDFEDILKPFMINLIGKVEAGELKPGAISAIPLLWDDPKGEKVQKMENILVNNLAVNFNDLYNFVVLMRKSLDPNLKIEDKKDLLPINIDEKNLDNMNMENAPLPANIDENAQPKIEQTEQIDQTQTSQAQESPEPVSEPVPTDQSQAEQT